MREPAAYGTAVVVLSTVANLGHGVSHLGQEVMSLPAWQWAYVGGVIFLAPVISAVLLWTPLRLAGAWLLLGSMAGSFVFDLAYHFLIPCPDNVSTLRPGGWSVSFSASATLVVVASGIGVLAGVWAVRGLSGPRTGTPPQEMRAARKGGR